MKKLIAMFVFAVGAGVTISATASSCDYTCSVLYRLCMKEATGTTDAEIACWEEYDSCTQSCSY